jgi:beta-glucosidase
MGFHRRSALVNSVSTPVMSLRRFSKIALAPGEIKTVNFTINSKDLSIWNRQMKLVTEPETFDVMIAKAADNVVRKKQLEYR